MWLNKEGGVDQPTSPHYEEMLEQQFLQENPLSKVFDLEDEQIQINRFGFLSECKTTIHYLELDSRIDLSPELFKRVLCSEFGLEEQLKKLKHFARKIKLVNNYISTSMTQGRSDIYLSRQQGNQNMNYFSETLDTFSSDCTFKVHEGRPLYVHRTNWNMFHHSSETFRMHSERSIDGLTF